MKRLALLVVGAATLASFNATAQSPTPSAAPTFAKDVAPIMYGKCANCHRPGQIAPMSLLTYDAARPWARRSSPVAAADAPGAPTSRRCRCATTSACRKEIAPLRRGSTAAPQGQRPRCRLLRSLRPVGPGTERT
jgi:predicted ribosomally synthesized peptide with SipW-like signal peptide